MRVEPGPFGLYSRHVAKVEQEKAADGAEASSARGSEHAVPSGRALGILLYFCGMSQKDLGKKAQIHKNQISDYIRGTRPLPNKHRLAILDALELTPRAWGYAEDLVLLLEADQGRFRHRNDPEQLYLPHRGIESLVRDEPRLPAEKSAPGGTSWLAVAALASIILERHNANDIATWTGSAIQDLVRKVLDLSPQD